jgi:hypothetical protein
MKQESFLQHYAEQFDAGAVNRENYLECAAYLEGLRDAMTPELSQEAINRMIRCANMMRGAANVIFILKQFDVPAGRATGSHP